MIGNTCVKVCGITRADDARLAVELGVDFIAFNLYPKSPRYLSLANYEALRANLPEGARRVAVLVEPTADELTAALEAGFDFFQIHARVEVPFTTVAAWSAAVGQARLWLAPKVPQGVAFPEEWLSLADTFLVDTFHAEGFGGSGRTGDWNGFAKLAAAHPEKTWVLAGGLSPDNVALARSASGSRFLDVNSGVESSPGVKSPEKLRALAAALHGLQT
jgi:phosphoribosylanthranilate isomerase